jgi:hypothetical protein
MAVKRIKQHHPDLEIAVWEEKSGQNEYIIISYYQRSSRIAVDKNSVRELALLICPELQEEVNKLKAAENVLKNKGYAL